MWIRFVKIIMDKYEKSGKHNKIEEFFVWKFENIKFQ